MSEPFIAEVKMFGGNFAPRGYTFCNGQLLQIAQYTALFSLVGTTYGGDGRTTLGLPDLRSRAPMQQGSGPGLTSRQLGEKVGTPNTTLTNLNTPNHSHQATVKVHIAQGMEQDPDGNYPATADDGEKNYGPAPTGGTPPTSGSNALPTAGSGSPYTNYSPGLGISFIIALVGTFPSRS